MARLARTMSRRVGPGNEDSESRVDVVAVAHPAGSIGAQPDRVADEGAGRAVRDAVVGVCRAPGERDVPVPAAPAQPPELMARVGAGEDDRASPAGEVVA